MTFVFVGKNKVYFNKQIININSLPKDKILKTWKFNTKLFEYNKNILFGELIYEGKKLSECSISNLFHYYVNKYKAFLKSAIETKININEIEILNLIPNEFLLEYYEYQIEEINKLIDNKINKNYYQLVEIENILRLLEEQELNIDISKLNDKLYSLRARELIKNLKIRKKHFISFNQFGSKTGRLTQNKTSFPILTLDTEFRNILRPTNSKFISIDFNAAEARVLMALSGQEQPKEDIHQYNADILNISRDDAKKNLFSWLYGAKNINGMEFNKLFNVDVVIEKYYNKEKQEVYTFFDRTIQSDEFHKLNHIIQSTTSDMVLRQMVKVWNFLKENKLKTKLSFILHDAFILDTDRNELEYCDRIVEIIRNNVFGEFLVNVSNGDSFGNLEPHKSIKK